MPSIGCFLVENYQSRLTQLQLFSPLGVSNSLTGKLFGSDGGHSSLEFTHAQKQKDTHTVIWIDSGYYGNPECKILTLSFQYFSTHAHTHTHTRIDSSYYGKQQCNM